MGSCTLTNVWFEDVCEDAISIKGDGTATIIGGGAYGADDKVYVGTALLLFQKDS